VAEWTQEFFAAKGKAVTAALLAQTADIDSMSRYLRQSIKRFLVYAARGTEVGAIRRKIEDPLAEASEFAQVPPGKAGAGRWQLVGSPQAHYGGDLGPLVAAAYAVPGVQAVLPARLARLVTAHPHAAAP
jgi:hypothetical protein